MKKYNLFKYLFFLELTLISITISAQRTYIEVTSYGNNKFEALIHAIFDICGATDTKVNFIEDGIIFSKNSNPDIFPKYICKFGRK